MNEQEYKNTPCFRWTKRHSQFGTFVHPSSIGTSSKCLSHKRPEEEWLTTIWAICVVEDVSIYLDILTLEFWAIWERPPILHKYERCCLDHRGYFSCSMCCTTAFPFRIRQKIVQCRRHRSHHFPRPCQTKHTMSEQWLFFLATPTWCNITCGTWLGATKSTCESWWWCVSARTRNVTCSLPTFFRSGIDSTCCFGWAGSFSTDNIHASHHVQTSYESIGPCLTSETRTRGDDDENSTLVSLLPDHIYPLGGFFFQ